MSAEDEMLDTRRMCLEGDFDEQVVSVLRHVRLTKQQVEEFSMLYEDLKDILQPEWPGCRVTPFGSIITGLGIKTSDVDCYIDIPSRHARPSKIYVLRAKKILSYYDRYREILAIPKAKVPIVKFLYAPINRHCDISFQGQAVQNSKLLAYLINSDPRILPLAVIVKYWSKLYAFTGTNLMSNYTLTFLLIFYLQQLTILPPIVELQRNVRPEFVDDWNTAFDDCYSHIVFNNDSLYTLLGGFFKYYSNFKFEDYIISPYLGSYFKRSVFNDVNTIQPEFDLYKNNVKNKFCKPLRTELIMCVQDCMNHSRNIAVSVSPRLGMQIISYFKSAAQIYERTQSSDFLRALLTVPNKPNDNPPHSKKRRNFKKITKERRNFVLKGNVLEHMRGKPSGHRGHAGHNDHVAFKARVKHNLNQIWLQMQAQRRTKTRHS